MRRVLFSLSALSLIVLGLGCKHVGGKSDCHAHPDNAEIAVGGGGQPYPALGAPMAGAAVPEKLGAPVEKAK